MPTYLAESIEKARLFNAETDANGDYRKESIPSVFLPIQNTMRDILREKFRFNALLTTYEIFLPKGEFLTVFAQKPENTSLIHSIISCPENRYLVNVTACANMDKVRVELMEFYQNSK